MNRRQVLTFATLPATLGLAGCQSGEYLLGRHESQIPPYDEQVEDFDDEYITVNDYAPRLVPPHSWFGVTTVAVVIRSEKEARHGVTTISMTDEASASALAFIDNMSFDDESVVYLRTTAPPTYYKIIDEFSLADDNRVTGEVTIRERESNRIDPPGMPTFFLRASGNDEPPTEAQFTINRASGDTDTVESTSYREYLLGYTTDDGQPPDDGDRVSLPGMCWNEQFEWVRFSSQILDDAGNVVADLGTSVGAEAGEDITRSTSNVIVGEDYTLTASVDDVAESEEFTATGDQIFEMRLSQEGALDIDVISFAEG